jgi:hypothetical protein
MTDVTRILSAIEQGDPSAAEQLLPVVYDELRKLAAQKLGHEAPGQTLQATALVHEAYLRLVDVDKAQQWDNRGHFFAAAAEAMRRILVENARRKNRPKHGGDRQRVDLDSPGFGLTREPGCARRSKATISAGNAKLATNSLRQLAHFVALTNVRRICTRCEACQLTPLPPKPSS